MTTNNHMPGLHANSADPWRPAPLVGASMLLHFVILIAWLIYPASWRWLIGIMAANHLLLFAAVFWPRGNLLGANRVRLPQAAMRRGEVSLTLDDGVDGDGASVLRRLTRGPAAGDILVLHDTASSRAAPGDTVVLAMLPALLERLAASGLKSVPLPTACGLDLQLGALPACNLLLSATVRS